MMPRAFRHAVLAIGALCVLVGVATAVNGGVRSRTTSVKRELVSGREVVFIFLGATFCRGAQTEAFRSALAGARRAVAAQAAAAQYGAASMGVAVDWRVDEGLAFLEGFEPFDEVLIGRNWMNAGAVRYLWRDLPGPPDLPQVVLIERSVRVGGIALEVSGERVLHRVRGADAIERWAGAGAPVPGLGPGSAETRP